MPFLEQWIHRQERKRVLVHAPFKEEHEFDWGLVHLGLTADSADPRELIARYTEAAIANSSRYFVPPPLPADAYDLRGRELTFPSTIRTFDAVNDVARCRYFPREGSKQAILLIPHWNSSGVSSDRMCRFLNLLGYSAIWMSLPFHGGRGGGRPTTPQSIPSTLLVSADIGLTLRLMQQAVQDALSTVSWLERKYERIGLLGASIGSCVAFLAAAHDPRVKGLFANLMSSHFGEVVWNGISTTHVRKSIEPHLDEATLSSAWLLNSPITFVPAMKRNNPHLAQFIVSGRFDSTFPFYLTRRMIDALERQGVPFEHRVLSCGHYTLATYWFAYLDGFYLWRFFRRTFGRDRA